MTADPTDPDALALAKELAAWINDDLDPDDPDDWASLKEMVAAFSRSRFEAGAEKMRERAAIAVESHKRDTSFDDSMVGAQEHNSNQANIAAAIRALPANPDRGEPQ